MFEESASGQTEDLLDTLATKEATEQAQLGKHLATAMASLAKIAKYYKRHGCLPHFTAIERPQAKRKLPKTVYESPITCGVCGLLFLGPISARCQCKVPTKFKAEVA